MFFRIEVNRFKYFGTPALLNADNTREKEVCLEITLYKLHKNKNVNAYISNKICGSMQKKLDYSLTMRYNKVNRFTKTIY